MTDPFSQSDYPYQFRDVDSFFKGLYYTNKFWFKVRTSLDDEQIKELSSAITAISANMGKIDRLLHGYYHAHHPAHPQEK